MGLIKDQCANTAYQALIKEQILFYNHYEVLQGV